jgi:hypothetical protein
MPDSFGFKLKHQVLVDRVDCSLDVPTRINIKKRRENVIYKTLSHRDNINLAYVMGSPITPQKNMAVSDRSTSLNQNRLPSTEQITIVSTKSFMVNIDKFLITDTFTTETPTKPKIPLFYNHILKHYNDDLPNFNDLSLLLLEFANEELHTIQVSDYVFDSTTGRLFNNLESTYDNETTDFNVYFLKYTVKSPDGVTVYHELLDNEIIYTQADFDDLDELGVLLPGKKKYLIETLPGGSSFLVTLAEEKLYAYKEVVNSRIRLASPSAIDITAPWYVNISSGNFIASLQRTVAGSFRNYKYHIAEFNSQLFNPFPPYKSQIEQKGLWLTPTLIRVPKNIAFDEGAGLFVDVIVKSNTRVTKAALTNDPDKIGLYYDGTVRYTEGILSVDRMGGFIELSRPIRSDDTTIISYFTEEEYYEFTGIDLNPIHNINIIEQRLVLYIHPETLATGTLERTLHFLIVNTLGEILYCSQVVDNKNSVDPVTTKLAEDFFANGSPRRIFYYDKPSTEDGLNSTVGSDEALEFSFIDKYTVESVLLKPPLPTPGTPKATNFDNNARLLILGDIYVGNWQAPHALNLFDMRVQGGGIKKEKREEAIKAQPEVTWFWDFSVNRPYPPGGFYVEVPQSLLEKNGGVFSIDQIRSVIEKHMKAGGYAVIKTYGIDPVITDVQSTVDSITVFWPDYGPNATFNVYISKESNKGFIQDNTLPIENNSNGNSYGITGLQSSTKYFIKISALDENDCESFSQTVEGITTTAII